MTAYQKFIKRWQSKLDEERCPWVEFGFLEGEFDPADPIPTADKLMVSIGFNGIGAGWEDLVWDAKPNWPFTSKEPKAHLPAFMRKGIAYSVDWLSEPEAADFATEFYNLFNPARLRHLTNGMNNGWNPVTHSTFDRAFVAMDTQLIGAIVIQDED